MKRKEDIKSEMIGKIKKRKKKCYKEQLACLKDTSSR